MLLRIALTEYTKRTGWGIRIGQCTVTLVAGTYIRAEDESKTNLADCHRFWFHKLLKKVILDVTAQFNIYIHVYIYIYIIFYSMR